MWCVLGNTINSERIHFFEKLSRPVGATKRRGVRCCQFLSHQVGRKHRQLPIRSHPNTPTKPVQCYYCMVYVYTVDRLAVIDYGTSLLPAPVRCCAAALLDAHSGCVFGALDVSYSLRSLCVRVTECVSLCAGACIWSVWQDQPIQHSTYQSHQTHQSPTDRLLGLSNPPWPASTEIKMVNERV